MKKQIEKDNPMLCYVKFLIMQLICLIKGPKLKPVKVKAKLRQCVVFFILLTLMAFPQAGFTQNDMPSMPKPGTLVMPSPEMNMTLLKGIRIYADDAFKMDFLVDEQKQDPETVKNEAAKLVNYFFSALTVKDEDQWVNLSPYENNRMIEDSFGRTQMGRDLLAQDYLLKQLSSSLLYPESPIGRQFWQEVYKKAKEQLGTTQVPISTIHKIWIVPQSATIFEKGQTAIINESHLKVMLEEDYLASDLNKGQAFEKKPQQNQDAAKALGFEVMRKIILPIVEKEVNEGKNFAPLRQVYSAMLLATWYKRALKDRLLNRNYTNQNKTDGIDRDNSRDNKRIYQQYIAAYKKGVFNYVRNEEDLNQQSVLRKYFSGGAVGWGQSQAMVSSTRDLPTSTSSWAVVKVETPQVVNKEKLRQIADERYRALMEDFKNAGINKIINPSFEIRLKAFLSSVEGEIFLNLIKERANPQEKVVVFSQREQIINEEMNNDRKEGRGFTSPWSDRKRATTTSDDQRPGLSRDKNDRIRGHNSSAFNTRELIGGKPIGQLGSKIPTNNSIPWKGSKAQVVYNPGGINMNSDNVDLKVENLGAGLTLPLLENAKQIEQISGLVPKILKIEFNKPINVILENQ